MTTALVTGASSGIGEVFARRLAARGHNLVLVARSTAKLDALAAELADAHGIKAETLTADLETADGVAAVGARAAEVDVVVNNAGYGLVGSVADLPVDGQLGEIRLNVEALVAVTHAALTTMVPRKAGTIINVSSTASFQPIPYTAVYAATKAFVSSFSQGLAEEVAPHGIRVLAVCPGYTKTGFQDRAGVEATNLPGFLWATPEQVVDCALRDLDRGRVVSIPGAVNVAIAASSKASPGWVTRKMSAFLTRRSEAP